MNALIDELKQSDWPTVRAALAKLKKFTKSQIAENTGGQAELSPRIVSILVTTVAHSWLPIMTRNETTAYFNVFFNLKNMHVLVTPALADSVHVFALVRDILHTSDWALVANTQIVKLVDAIVRIPDVFHALMTHSGTDISTATRAFFCSLRNNAAGASLELKETLVVRMARRGLVSRCFDILHITLLIQTSTDLDLAIREQLLVAYVERSKSLSDLADLHVFGLVSCNVYATLIAMPIAYWQITEITKQIDSAVMAYLVQTWANAGFVSRAPIPFQTRVASSLACACRHDIPIDDKTRMVFMQSVGLYLDAGRDETRELGIVIAEILMPKINPGDISLKFGVKTRFEWLRVPPVEDDQIQVVDIPNTDLDLLDTTVDSDEEEDPDQIMDFKKALSQNKRLPFVSQPLEVVSSTNPRPKSRIKYIACNLVICNKP